MQKFLASASTTQAAAFAAPRWLTGAPAAAGLAMALLASVACSGSEGSKPDKPPGYQGPDIEKDNLGRLTPEAMAACVARKEPLDPGLPVARRLNRREYDNTIADLLFDSSRPSVAFPIDQRDLHFDTSSSALNVPPALAEAYFSTSRALAEKAVKDQLGKLLPCEPQGDASACADQFIDSFGQRAYRRPLDNDERATLKGVFEIGSKTSFERGIELVIEVAIQSAPFLYRMEEQTFDKEDIVAVDSWQMASRLSYLLWASMPDQELFDAAKGDKLRNRDEIERQVKRMLDDPRSINLVGTFHEQWLGLDDQNVLDKDKTVYPDWQPARFGQMREELRRFTDELVVAGGNFEELMTAQHSFINQELAQHYGVQPPSEDGFARVDFPNGQRAGVLTFGAVLANKSKVNQASPILRGILIREQLMCQPVPPPPQGVDNSPPALDPSLTTRERFAVVTADAACGNCHKLIDPPGFALSNFDAVGRYQDKENDQTIDASGDLSDSDVEGSFNNATELSQMLARSAEVKRCFANNWFRFAFGRAETEADACALAQLDAQLASPKRNLTDLIITLTNLDTFQFRRVEAQQ